LASSDKTEAFRLFGEWEKSHDWRKNWKVSREQTLLFTRQLTALLSAGLNILPSLEALEQQIDKELAPVVQELSKQLTAGHYLSASLSLFPRVFPPVYVAMVRVGETTGSLNLVLQLLCDWLSGEEALLRKVKTVLTYPLIVLFCSVIMCLYLFLQVMPGFVSIFDELDAQLPLLTHVLMILTRAVANPFAWVATALVLSVLTKLARDYLRTQKGAVRYYSFLLKLPVVGVLLRLITASRFCSALAALTATGTTLPKALRLACQASGNPVLNQRSDALINQIAQGETVSSYLESDPELFPNLLPYMMAVGEETGSVAQVMNTASAYFREEVDRRLETLTSLLEPLMLSLASLGVGTILLGVFMPLYGFLGEVS
jgi:type II secretory pathway component PulF